MGTNHNSCAVPSWRVKWHAEIGSTMDQVAELAASGEPSGAVVVADYQTQGRGTHGRRWEAPPGSCLMFSVLLRPRLEIGNLERLPLRIAESICEVLQKNLDVPAEVSPPNDIVIRGKKVCGVLATSRITGRRLNWITVGIGLNTFMTSEELPVGDATSLSIECSVHLPSHEELLATLLDALAWLEVGSASCAGYTDKPILSSNAR